MKLNLKTYVNLWLLLAAGLAFEAYALNHNTFVSLFAVLKENLESFKELNLSPAPGKTISLWYGWTGLTLMIMTNLYILRKHWAPMKKIGRLPNWLDFHIFCGLLGPTFILFHSNFKVGGLVAISFWSMVISFSSGIVGRYFYMQLMRQKAELEKDAQASEKIVRQEMPGAADDIIKNILGRSLRLAGAHGENVSIWRAITSSLFGDIRLRLGVSKLNSNLSPLGRGALREYAKTRRRVGYLAQFQSVMGYWHSFHMPFAVFMYLVAVIHVAVALVLKVR